jgi:RND family efflux transporter MFP subunit
MATTLREELASLKIERSDSRQSTSKSNPSIQYRRSGGLRILSWLLWMIPLGLLSGAGVVAYRQYDQIRSKVEVQVADVQKMTMGEAEKLLTAKGYLKAERQAMIGTKVAGRVQEMRVKEHDEVKKDEVLAVIEHYDLDAMIENRKAALEKAKADLDEARADLWEKTREANRAERLIAKKMVNQEDYEKASSTAKMCTARVASLEAQIKMMSASIKEMEYTLEYQMKIHAPFNGTVVEKQGEVGEVINPMAMSSSLGRSAVVTVADLKNIDVEADVTEEYLSRIALGQPAEVSVTAVPDKRYAAFLRQIIPMGDRTRATVKVKVKITDPDDRLFPELAATVHFLPFKHGDARAKTGSYLFVHNAAVFKENGLDYVWVVDKQKSRVKKRQVEVSATKADLARVESGLKAEESVVLNPPKTLKDDEVVKIPERS